MRNDRRACIGLAVIIWVLFFIGLYALTLGSQSVMAPATL
jgi:hypothetical protein